MRIYYPIFPSLNPNKAHGWDNISIKMIKRCGDKLVTPLEIIFRNCVNQSVYPSIWKRSNVAPVYKKVTKTKLIITDQFLCSQFLAKCLRS